MFRKIINKVMGDPNQKEIDKLMPEVDEVNALEPEMKGKSDNDLKQMMADFKAEIQTETKEAREDFARLEQEAFAAFGEDRQRLEVTVERAKKSLLDLEAKLLYEIRPEVFAAVREAAVRTIDHRHYVLAASLDGYASCTSLVRVVERAIHLLAFRLEDGALAVQVALFLIECTKAPVRCEQ